MDHRHRHRHRHRRPGGRWRRFKRDVKDGCGDCGCEGCTGAGDCLLLLLSPLCLARVCLLTLTARGADPHTAAPATVAARFLWRAVRTYQLEVSVRRARPVCRLSPSCSRFALRALSSHGALRGVLLVAQRLDDCRAAARADRGTA